MKKIIYPTIIALISTTVTADFGMMGTGMMGSYGMGIIWPFYFALMAFIFSIIFWLTHNWLTSKKKK